MATEVFNRIGEEEIYSEKPNFYKKHGLENEGLNEPENIESISKPMTKTKKEFFEHLNDDSLTIDTCTKLNHDS
jgi:hypothetical protein